MKELRKAIDDYLQLRRGLGYKLEGYERHLRGFAELLENERATRITTSLALRFATDNTRIDSCGRVVRMSVVRGFACYWQALDPTSEIPPTGLLRCPRKRAKPRLCSQQELIRLLGATDRDRSTGTRGLRPWTLFVLFGLLAVTGMRVSEAIHLRLEDVDWTESLLTIRNTKFGKSRRVPLHHSTLEMLRSYARRRDRFLRGGWRGTNAQRASGLFFVSNRGTSLSGSYLRYSFRDLIRKAGLAQNGRPCMRIHDLRHRFAVESLRQWYREDRTNVEARLPALATFLGHVNVAATYWYLSSTPTLQAAAIGRVESHWEGVADETA